MLCLPAGVNPQVKRLSCYLFYHNYFGAWKLLFLSIANGVAILYRMEKTHMRWVLFSGLKSLFVGVSSDMGISRIRFKDWDRTVISSHRAVPHWGHYPHWGRYPHRGRQHWHFVDAEIIVNGSLRFVEGVTGPNRELLFQVLCVCPFVCVRELIGPWVLNHQFTCLLYKWIWLKKT